jgi:hypothetical protein
LEGRVNTHLKGPLVRENSTYDYENPGAFYTTVCMSPTNMWVDGMVLFTAPFACTLKRLTLRCVTAAAATGKTVMFEKCGSGTAAGSGSDLLAVNLNLESGITANTNATPTLTTTSASLSFAAGDSVVVNLISGAQPPGVGSVTMCFVPA